MPTTKNVKTKEVDASVEVKEVQEVKSVVKTEKPVIRKYAPDETIPVRSVTQGELLLPGKKSDILYRWAGYGDMVEVEYQDLYSLKVTRSPYVYGPLFVIEDEELLADPKWKDVVTVYESMFDASDIGTILALAPGQFKEVLKQLPNAYLKAVKIEAATRIENGTFDSLQKIKILDEVCGTDFHCLV